MKEISISQKVKVIKLFLSGQTYDEIGQQVGVAKGSVVNIIDEFREGYLSLPPGVTEYVNELRKLAVDLKKQDTTVTQVKSYIKLHAKLKEMGVNSEQVDKWLDICQGIATSQVTTNQFVKAALELAQLTSANGLSYTEVITDYNSKLDTSMKLDKDIEQEKEELNQLKSQYKEEKQQATETLNSITKAITTAQDTHQKQKEELKSQLEEYLAQNKLTWDKINTVSAILHSVLSNSGLDQKDIERISKEIANAGSLVIYTGQLEHKKEKLRSTVDQLSQQEKALTSNVNGLGNVNIKLFNSILEKGQEEKELDARLEVKRAKLAELEEIVSGYINDIRNVHIIIGFLISPKDLGDSDIDELVRLMICLRQQKLGIPKGNGTVVTIEVDSHRFRIPQHESLIENFQRYYSLRDLLSNSDRRIELVDLHTGKEQPLTYTYPLGEVVFDDNIAIPDYPGVKANLLIRKHSTPFQQDHLPYREGMLVKSAAAIHDCTYFGLDLDPFSWRFTGEVRCEFIDTLVREYDDRDDANPDCPNHSANNPIRLLDPLRSEGLIPDHPFAKKLQERCRKILKHLIEALKTAEAPPKRDVTDENLDKKLDNLSKEISKVFEKKLQEMEEEVLPGLEPLGPIEELPVGLHIIPPGEEPVVVNEPKTFSIKVKHYEALDRSLPITVDSSDTEIKVRASPVFLRKFSEDGRVGATTFTLESSKIGAEAIVEAHYDGYDNMVLVKVVEPPPPPSLPEGLSFDKPLYHLRINKEKILILWLKTTKLEKPTMAEITSDHPKIVVKGGGKCELHESDIPGVLLGKCRIIRRQLKTKGSIAARVDGFGSTETRVVVEEREPRSRVRLDFKPVEDNFGSVRYKWHDENPYLLLIGAKHPSIRRYLGEPSEDIYPGINSSNYHIVLAEVVAEALAFYVLEKQFKGQGQEGMLDYTSVDAYYHKHFSDFLTIAHKSLVTEVS